MLRDAFRQSSDERRPGHGALSTSALQEEFETLSSREQSLLQRVAEGYSVVQIARMLNITPRTVGAYKARIARKLGLTHRTDYVRFALQLGLIGSASSQQGAITTGARSPSLRGS